MTRAEAARLSGRTGDGVDYLRRRGMTLEQIAKTPKRQGHPITGPRVDGAKGSHGRFLSEGCIKGWASKIGVSETRLRRRAHKLGTLRAAVESFAPGAWPAPDP